MRENKKVDDQGWFTISVGDHLFNYTAAWYRIIMIIPLTIMYQCHHRLTFYCNSIIGHFLDSWLASVTTPTSIFRRSYNTFRIEILGWRSIVSIHKCCPNAFKLSGNRFFPQTCHRFCYGRILKTLTKQCLKGSWRLFERLVRESLAIALFYYTQQTWWGSKVYISKSGW